MKRTRKEIQKVIRFLTDPIPQFVSMVRHGANQTPYKVVKSIEGQEVAQKEDLTDNQFVDLKKIMFDKTNFKSKKDVGNWLSENGFEDYDITTKDNNYIVEDTEIESDKEVEIELQKGITFVLSDKRDTEEKEESTKTIIPKGDFHPANQRTKKTLKTVLESAKKENPTIVSEMEETHKFNWFLSEMSDSTNLYEVLRDGDDGLPVGMSQLNDALYTAMRNAFLDNNFDAVSSITKDFGNAAVYLYRLYANDFTSVSASAQNSQKEGDEMAVIFDQKEQETTQKTEETKVEEVKKEEIKTPETAQKAEETKPEEAKKEDAPKEESKKEETSPLDAISATLKSIDEKMATKSDVQSVETKIKDLDDRITSIEGDLGKQTSKSLNIEDADQQPTQKSEEVRKNQITNFASRIGGFTNLKLTI